MTTSSAAIISNLNFYTLWPKLTLAETKVILSAYNYLTRDFSISAVQERVQDGADLKPDGLLQVLWSNYPFRGTLNTHPWTLREALKASFESNKTQFLQYLEPDRVYALINDESSDTSNEKTRYFFSWAETYGVDRILPMGNVGRTASGGPIAWYDNSSTFPNVPGQTPLIDNRSKPEAVKSRLDSYPAGHKGVYLRPYGFQKYNLPSGSFDYRTGTNSDLAHFLNSFAEGAATQVAVDSYVSGILGGASGTATYTIPSGYHGIYFDDWDDVVKRTHAWFKQYKDLGGEIDWIILDTEVLNQALWPYYISQQRFYTGDGYSSTTVAAQSTKKPWTQIVEDSRFADLMTNYPDLPPSADIYYGFNNWSLNSPENFAFCEVTQRRLVDQFNNKVVSVIKSYFPNVKLTNYDFTYKAPLVMPNTEPFTFKANPSGVGAVFGTHGSAVTYMSMNRNGADTGKMYLDHLTGTTSQRITAPPLTDYAYANGVPNSGGFITFLQDIRTLRGHLAASNKPLTQWVNGPLDAPYYPHTPVKSVILEGAATRKNGKWDHLYDELNAHGLLSCDQMFIYNPSDKAYLTTDAVGPKYPTSGDYSLCYKASFDPSGITTNNVTDLVMWLNFSDTTRMYPAIGGPTGVNVSANDSTGFVVDRMGNYNASGVATSKRPLYRVNNPTITRTNNTGGLQFDGSDDYMLIDPIATSDLSGGFTLFLSIAGSGYASKDIFGSTDTTLPAPLRSLMRTFLFSSGPWLWYLGGSTVLQQSEHPMPTTSPGHGSVYAITVNPRRLNVSADMSLPITTYANGGYQFQAANDNLLSYVSGFITGEIFNGVTKKWGIGAMNNGNTTTSSPHAIVFHDILLYKKPLTDGEVRDVSAYLYNKHKYIDNVGNASKFYVYPNRSDAASGNARLVNMCLEFESIGGGYIGTPEVWAEPLLHSVSGIVSTINVPGKRISRLTPNPELLSSVQVTNIADSGINFKIGSWQVDFPRGTFPNISNPVVAQPSGYWIVQTNRTGQDAIDYRTNRLQNIKDMFGYIPAVINPDQNSRTTTSIWNEPIRNAGAQIIYAGDTDRFSNITLGDKNPNGEFGSNPSTITMSVTSGTAGVVGNDFNPYLPNVITQAPIDAIHPNQRETVVAPSVGSESDQPSRSNPGEITFATGSKIPRNMDYLPKTV